MQQNTSNPVALVVEDDEHIAHLLKFMLERVDYRVEHLREGRAAREYMRSQPAPTVALLDIMLPFVDGVQLVGMMRAQPGWGGVPVIMLTAKSQGADIARALDAGANDYVVKPFQPDELLARLRRLTRAAT